MSSSDEFPGVDVFAFFFGGGCGGGDDIESGEVDFETSFTMLEMESKGAAGFVGVLLLTLVFGLLDTDFLPDFLPFSTFFCLFLPEVSSSLPTSFFGGDSFSVLRVEESSSDCPRLLRVEDLVNFELDCSTKFRLSFGDCDFPTKGTLEDDEAREAEGRRFPKADCTVAHSSGSG